jgi:hypothetical protein
MKAYITIISIALFGAVTAFSQDNNQNPTTQAIQAKQYTFKARTAMPTSGSTRQLTSDYDFTVSHDSVISYLPYFGRAYVAPIGKTDNGLNFTSTKFSYNVKESKKGGWTIEIRPKDADDVQMVTLNVSKNGYGTLHVNSRNRQAIAYTGRLEPLKQQ